MLTSREWTLPNLIELDVPCWRINVYYDLPVFSQFAPKLRTLCVDSFYHESPFIFRNSSLRNLILTDQLIIQNPFPYGLKIIADSRSGYFRVDLTHDPEDVREVIVSFLSGWEVRNVDRLDIRRGTNDGCCGQHGEALGYGTEDRAKYDRRLLHTMQGMWNHYQGKVSLVEFQVTWEDARRVFPLNFC